MIVSVTMESPVPSAMTRMVVNKKEGREGKVFLWLAQRDFICIGNWKL